MNSCCIWNKNNVGTEGLGLRARTGGAICRGRRELLPAQPSHSTLLCLESKLVVGLVAKEKCSNLITKYVVGLMGIL